MTGVQATELYNRYWDKLFDSCNASSWMTSMKQEEVVRVLLSVSQRRLNHSYSSL